MGTLFGDLRFAPRALRRNTGFAAVAVLAAALRAVRMDPVVALRSE